MSSDIYNHPSQLAATLGQPLKAFADTLSDAASAYLVSIVNKTPEKTFNELVTILEANDIKENLEANDIKENLGKHIQAPTTYQFLGSSVVNPAPVFCTTDAITVSAVPSSDDLQKEWTTSNSWIINQLSSLQYYEPIDFNSIPESQLTRAIELLDQKIGDQWYIGVVRSADYTARASLRLIHKDTLVTKCATMILRLTPSGSMGGSPLGFSEPFNKVHEQVKYLSTDYAEWSYDNLAPEVIEATINQTVLCIEKYLKDVAAWTASLDEAAAKLQLRKDQWGEYCAAMGQPSTNVDYFRVPLGNRTSAKVTRDSQYNIEVKLNANGKATLEFMASIALTLKAKKKLAEAVTKVTSEEPVAA